MKQIAVNEILPEKESENMTEREITKLASDLYDEGLRAVHGNPLQYSCLEKPIDRETWWAMVHRVANTPRGLK